MIRLRTIPAALTLLLAATAALPGAAAESGRPRWEVVETLPADIVEPQSERVDVIVRDGVIYLAVPRPTQVKLFTILGQPVAQDRLPAGTSRLRPPGRGIYILKAGSYTCRVTI